MDTTDNKPFIPFARQWSLRNGFGSAERADELAQFPETVGRESLSFENLGAGCGLFRYSGVTYQPVHIQGTVISDRPFVMIRIPRAGATNFHFGKAGSICESPDRYGLFLHAHLDVPAASESRPNDPCGVVVPMISVDQLATMLMGMHAPKVIQDFLDGRGDNAVINPRMSVAMRQLGRHLEAPSPYHGDLSRFHLQGKLFELFGEIVNDLGDDGQTAWPQGRGGRAKVSTVCDMLLANLDHPPPLESLAREVGWSVKRLSDTFREVTGKTVTAWVVAQKLVRAAELLCEGGIPIKEISHRLGYSHVSTFSAAFTRRFGIPPAGYRRG